MKSRRFKLILVVLLLAFAGAALLGCSGDGGPDTGAPPSENGNNNGDPAPSEPPATENPVSLGGIYLGMSLEELDQLQTAGYSDRLEAEFAYFGENIIFRQYDNGCHVVIDKDTGKVLQIDVSSQDYPTDRGFKVGAPALEVLEDYRQDYEEWVGNQSPDKLVGWFLIEEETLLIFSSKENLERFNEELTEDSQIYGITLGSPRYFD